MKIGWKIKRFVYAGYSFFVPVVYKNQDKKSTIYETISIKIEKLFMLNINKYLVERIIDLAYKHKLKNLTLKFKSS